MPGRVPGSGAAGRWAWTVGRPVLLAIVTLAGLRATAQEGATATPGEELEIYVMTMGPGDQVWTRFGHNAIGIRDRRAGTDIVYNWGTFDFQQQHFLLRFVQGRMLYWVAESDARLTEAAYARENRRVDIQELALSPGQRAAVRDYIVWNLREENRYYRYDYFLDNCSTRVRDVLDRASGGALRRQFGDAPSGISFRDEARRLMEPDPWVYTGIDIGLGSPADREMSRWEAMFIPMRVRDMLREVQVAGDAGRTAPLVASERTVVTADRPPEHPVAPNRVPRYLLIGGALAALIVLTASLGRAGVARIVAITWCVVAGIVGGLLLGLWLATDHVWAYANINLLFFHPLWFAAIPAVRRAGPVATARGRGVMVACGALAVLGLLLALAGVPQHSVQVAALAVPVGLATVWLVLRRAGMPATA